MVTQVFNLLRKIPVQLKLDFCVSLFSVLPQSPSFLLHTRRGGEIWFYKLWRRYITYIQSNSLPLWLKRHGGWGEREYVCCKTISYQDNISNSIYDSQESTPTRTRNIPYPALTPEPKLKNRILRMQRRFSVQYLLVCCVCLLFEDDDWSDVILFAFYSAEFCSFHPWRIMWPGHREARGERGVGSGQLLLEWSLITAGGAHSAFLGGASQHHSSALSALCSWPSPGHRPHSHNIHSAVSNPGQIPVQGIYNNMQIKLAHCICVHYGLTICITLTVPTAPLFIH